MKRTKNFCKRLRIISVLLGAISIMIIVGCAGGPKYSVVKNDIAEITKGQGRIIFYRPSRVFGFAMKAAIFLDGKRIGTSRNGTIFYVDVDAGKHDVGVPAIFYPGGRKIEVNVGQHETVYVRTSLGGSSFGGRTNIEVISAEQALTEIENLSLINR